MHACPSLATADMSATEHLNCSCGAVQWPTKLILLGNSHDENKDCFYRKLALVHSGFKNRLCCGCMSPPVKLQITFMSVQTHVIYIYIVKTLKEFIKQ